MRALVVPIACALLSASAAAQDPWCWNADDVQVRVVGDRLHVRHLAALLNCCPEPIRYDVYVGDVTIFIEEHSVSPCDCDCCFNLELTLDDVGPGPWVVRYRWFDIEVQDWAEREFQIAVPDVGQPFETYVLSQASYGCLEPGEVADDGPIVREHSWGKVKRLYR